MIEFTELALLQESLRLPHVIGGNFRLNSKEQVVQESFLDGLLKTLQYSDAGFDISFGSAGLADVVYPLSQF